MAVLMISGVDFKVIAFFAAAGLATALVSFLVLRAYVRTGEPAPKPLAALAVCAGGGLLAIGLYAFLGSPGAADQPYAPRLAALEAADPNSLGPFEIVALEEARAAADPNDPMAPFIVAAVYEQTGNLEQARVAYDVALRRAARLAASPQTPEEDRDILRRAQGLAMVRLGLILTEQNGGVASDQALSLFTTASTLSPDNPEPWLHRAYAASLAGQHAQAVTLWDEALARLPADNPMRTMAERLRGFAVRGEVPGPPPSLDGRAPT